MYRIAIFDEFMEIYTGRLSDKSLQKIIDTLESLHAEYKKGDFDIIVERPTYKLLLELCCFSDIVLM